MSPAITSVIKPAAQPNPLIHPALKSFDELPDSAYVPLIIVCALFSCSSATVWRRVRSGQLVSPVRIGSRTTRWKVADLRRTLLEMNPTGSRHAAK